MRVKGALVRFTSRKQAYISTALSKQGSMVSSCSFMVVDDNRDDGGGGGNHGDDGDDGDGDDKRCPNGGAPGNSQRFQFSLNQS